MNITFALPDYSSGVIERHENLFYGRLINLALEFDIHVVVVVVDSHIQRIVLATEETTVTQQVSHKQRVKTDPKGK